MNEQQKAAIVKYRITKARVTYNEVEFLINNSLFNTAINRLYYSCYYAVSALLINDDLVPVTHAGVRQMFGLHFVKTGIIKSQSSKFYSEIFNLRQTGDYDDFIDFTKNQVDALLIPANELISTIEGILSKSGYAE